MNVDSEESPKSTAGAWLFTILYCAFSWGLFYFAVTVWKEFMPIAIMGFFAFFGVVYLVMTIRQTLGQQKFGAVRFLMERPPPAVGGQLRGSVTLPRAAFEAKTLVAELLCTKETLAIGAKSVQKEAIWQGRRSFPIRMKPGGASAAIAIDIPAELEATRLRPASWSMKAGDPPRHYWSYTLTISADLPGLDLERTYPIEVKPMQPGATPAAAPVAAPAAAAAAAPAAVAEPVHEEGIGASLWVLVAVNLLPIAGVAFWGWSAAQVIFLYWMENLVIGAFNVLRILTADPVAPSGIQASRGGVFFGKVFLAAFFVMHYGGFCFGHGEFLAGAFAADLGRGRGLGPAVAAVLSERTALVALAAMVASHGYSYFRNYLGKGEFREVDVGEMMFRPYKRIVVTHIFIIAGGFLLLSLKSPVAAMVVFIAIKTGFDAYFHRREHRPKPAS